MSWNLQQTINWAKTFIQYSPLTAGLGNEPAVSIASMIRASIMNPGNVWFFNRNTLTFATTAGTQDYTKAVADLAFVEKASILDDQGHIFEIKDIYNNAALSPSAVQQRPSALSVESYTNGSAIFRLLGVPDQIYTVTVTYQSIPAMFGPFFITSVANAVGANTTYTGNFDPISFPTGATAVITGFVTNAVNNGSFVVVSCNATTLVVANAAGVAETHQAYASNFSWDPIPDYYSDIFNNLFLSEVMSMVDDARAAYYRQRGVAALLAKASGLTEMQKNIFAQQWLVRGSERTAAAIATQQGQQARGV